MIHYEYNGAVFRSSPSRCVAQNWKAKTYAISEEKAKTNLSYQYKKQHGLVPGVKITLPDEVREVKDGH